MAKPLSQAKPDRQPIRQEDRLMALISPMLEPMGYEVVDLEVQNQRHKVLRIFIDRAQEPSRVGIEDCVKVTKALDEPLDQLPEMEEIFKGAYELEVSSPGIDRPLRRPADYEKFSGQEVRLHTYRPLTANELGNPSYQSRNPKQKNFLGTLKGLDGESIRLSVGEGKGQEEIILPLALISKANLEPSFEIQPEKTVSKGRK